MAKSGGPIPYPHIAKSADLAKGSKNVKINAQSILGV